MSADMHVAEESKDSIIASPLKSEQKKALSSVWTYHSHVEPSITATEWRCDIFVSIPVFVGQIEVAQFINSLVDKGKNCIDERQKDFISAKAEEEVHQSMFPSSQKEIIFVIEILMGNKSDSLQERTKQFMKLLSPLRCGMIIKTFVDKENSIDRYIVHVGIMFDLGEGLTKVKIFDLQRKICSAIKKSNVLQFMFSKWAIRKGCVEIVNFMGN